MLVVEIITKDGYEGYAFDNSDLDVLEKALKFREVRYFISIPHSKYHMHSLSVDAILKHIPVPVCNDNDNMDLLYAKDDNYWQN